MAIIRAAESESDIYKATNLTTEGDKSHFFKLLKVKVIEGNTVQTMIGQWSLCLLTKVDKAAGRYQFHVLTPAPKENLLCGECFAALTCGRQRIMAGVQLSLE